MAANAVKQKPSINSEIICSPLTSSRFSGFFFCPIGFDKISVVHIATYAFSTQQQQQLIFTVCVSIRMRSD